MSLKVLQSLSGVVGRGPKAPRWLQRALFMGIPRIQGLPQTAVDPAAEVKESLKKDGYRLREPLDDGNVFLVAPLKEADGEA